MRLGSRRYWGLFAIFLAITIIRGLAATYLEGSAPNFLGEPVEQADDVRLDELRVEPPIVATPGSQGQAPEHLVGPVYIEMAPDGRLFVADEGDGDVIKEFSSEGDLLVDHSLYGRGNIQSVTDFAFGTDEVWVADLLGTAVHVLDRRKDRWSSIALDFDPYRLELFPNEANLLVMRIGAPEMFSAVSRSGRTLDSFGVILKDQKEHALALSGFIARSGSRLIFAGKWLPGIVSFEQGAPSFLRQPISPPGTPVVMEQEGTTWLHHGPLPASIAITADERGFYVLTRRRLGVDVRSVIDLYWARDGSYYKSLLLPPGERWNSLTMGAGHLYVAGTGAVVRWPDTVLREELTSIPNSTGRPILRLKLKDVLERRN